MLIAVMLIGTKALQAVRMKTFSIELLIMLAVIGALIIGEYMESAVITFLFLFGDYLEGRTLAKTRSALKELTDLAPLEAVIVQGGTRLTVCRWMKWKKVSVSSPGPAVKCRLTGRF